MTNGMSSANNNNPDGGCWCQKFMLDGNFIWCVFYVFQMLTAILIMGWIYSIIYGVQMIQDASEFDQ